MERKISEKGYTLRELILAVREEYLKEAYEANIEYDFICIRRKY